MVVPWDQGWFVDQEAVRKGPVRMKGFLNWCSDLNDEYEDDPGTLFLLFIVLIVVTTGVIALIAGTGGIALVVVAVVWGLWQVFKAVISLGATMNEKDEE